MYELCFIYRSISCIPFSNLLGKINAKGVGEITSLVWITSQTVLSDLLLQVGISAIVMLIQQFDNGYLRKNLISYVPAWKEAFR